MENRDIKTKNFRQEIADAFIKALEEDPITFISGWDFSSTGSPVNGFTNREYKGINKLILKLKEVKQGYADSRWMTFKQIQEKGYSLEKGAKGQKIEYWLPWNPKEKKWITWKEYETKVKNIEEGMEKPIELRQKLYTVFNGSQIKGLEPVQVDLKLNDIKENEVVNKISEALGVPIEKRFNSSMAYYSPSEDKIVLPIKEQFKSDSAYARTALHELGHSTGHEKRLNRTFGGTFGDEKYAYEELVAEITSAFMGEFMKADNTAEFDQHKAYIQSWSKSIKEDKNFLFGAIKDADKAAEYMVDKAQLRGIPYEKEKNYLERVSFFSKDKKEYEF